MRLSNLQPLLQLLTSGRKTELKVRVKVFSATPAGLFLNAIGDGFVLTLGLGFMRPVRREKNYFIDLCRETNYECFYPGHTLDV